MIAGNGRFPILFANEASRNGLKVVVIGIKGETSPELKKMVESFYWIKLGQLSKMINLLKAEGIFKAVMAGHIKHVHIFRQLSLDLKAFNLLTKLKDKKADTLLGGIVEVLETEGIKILPSTTFLSHLIPSKGIMTKRRPTKREEKDIAFGTRIAKEVAGLDIGQTIVVKNGSVVAVEAMEGTDETIKRAGLIGGKGIVVVKVSKPKQDLRFDVPVIGEKTIGTMIEARASVLAIDGEKSLFFEQKRTLETANEHDICILAQ